MKNALISASVLTISMCIPTSGSAQGIVSDLEPKAPVTLAINSVEKFQQDLDLYGPQFGLVSRSANAGNARIHKSITDTQTGLTFVTSSGDLSLKRIENSPDGDVRYLASLQDRWNGRARTIRQSDISLVDQNSYEVDFALSPFTSERLPVSVAIMLDSSKSMDGYMPDVIAAANELFDSLPDHIRCEALVFETGYRWYGDADTECSSAGVAIPQINAKGITNLYTAMTDAYEQLNGREGDVVQTLIVLTDGRPLDEEQRSRAFAAKGGVPTIFLWLGNKSGSAEAEFSDFADAYVDDPDGAWRHLEDYFSVYADALNRQSVITVTGQGR